jgi:glycosyltransferase involved in cell wall biosynthesis
MATVTVLIPTYNRERYLTQALDSVLTQGFGDIEVIVSNNHSTDGTAALLAAYEAKDARVRAVMPPKAITGPQNHQFLLEEAFRSSRAPFITYLGDDDFWEPTFLEKTLAAIQEGEGYDVAAAGWYIWMEEQDERQTYVNLPNGPMNDPVHTIYAARPLHVGSLLMRRTAAERAGGMNGEIANCDYDMYIRMAREGMRFYYVAEALMCYRIHPGAHCARVAEVAADYAQILESYPSDDPATERTRRKKIGDNFASAGRAMSDGGDARAARGYFTRGLRAAPTHPRLWAGLALTFVPSGLAHLLVRVKRSFSDSPSDRSRRQSQSPGPAKM